MGCVHVALNVPNIVLFALQRLEGSGFDAYLVGGCVRDSLLGMTPHDWDICTDALPEDVLQCFEDQEVVCIGMRHGTVGVVLEGQMLEITTFRLDGTYSDQRHPDQVTFTKSLELDLKRRDFTINAMAYHLQKGVIDLFGGRADLQAGKIRCVGDAKTRFTEDALRILRGLRFSATLGFCVEETTAQAMHQQRMGLTAVAMERIRGEWDRILLGGNASIVLSDFFSIVAVLIPELQSCFISNHQAQVEWRSLANTIASSPPSRAIRWVLLLDLITRRRDAGAARQILQRFCYGQKEVQYILQLLKQKEKKLLPKPPCAKRALRLLGMQGILDLIAVQEALATPKGCRRAMGDLRRVKSLVREIVGSGACYSLDTLAVNGKDLIELGIPEGPKVGGLLEKIMMQVIDDQLENNRESLLHYAKGVLHEFS